MCPQCPVCGIVRGRSTAGGMCVRARTRVHGTTKTRMVRRDDALYTFSPSKGTNRTTPFTSSILGRKGIYYVILFLVRILRGP